MLTFVKFKKKIYAVCTAAAHVEQEMKRDWLFAPHYRYYVREMRILAYNQLLESYRSLTLGYMAEAFGVSTEFIDQCVHVLRYHAFIRYIHR